MPDAGDASHPPLRFVVLRHDGVPDPHFDLMFESNPGGLLDTWRSPVWPISTPVRLTPLDRHRREYLTYEGPVSNNRGSVARVAEGSYERLPAASDDFGYLLRPTDGPTIRLHINANIAEAEAD